MAGPAAARTAGLAEAAALTLVDVRIVPTHALCVHPIHAAALSLVDVRVVLEIDPAGVLEAEDHVVELLHHLSWGKLAEVAAALGRVAARVPARRGAGTSPTSRQRSAAASRAGCGKPCDQIRPDPAISNGEGSGMERGGQWHGAGRAVAS